MRGRRDDTARGFQWRRFEESVSRRRITFSGCAGAVDITGQGFTVNGTSAGSVLRMLLPGCQVLRSDEPLPNSLYVWNPLSLPDKVLLAGTATLSGYGYANSIGLGYCASPLTLYADADGDDHGDPAAMVRACAPITGYVSNSTDCNDADASIHPGAYEACDGIDNDCNGSTDENSIAFAWYHDNDEDGAGGGAPVVFSCMDQPGLVTDHSDCDDSVPGMFVGSGCEDGDPRTGGEVWQEGCVCALPGTVYLKPRVLLQGPFNATTQLMNDGLRTSGQLPLQLDWQGEGFPMNNGALEDVLDPSALLISGPDAIVDHVLLEVRDAIDPSNILFSRYCFLQRDGDVVPSPPGTTCAMNAPPGNYYVAIRHRNHLAVMTASPIFLGQQPEVVDLSQSTSALYGTNPAAVIGTRKAMWAGDTGGDNVITYTGVNNDRDKILIAVGSTNPNGSVDGYLMQDINLDGTVRYTGANNDRDAILISVGGTTPNNVRTGQVP